MKKPSVEIYQTSKEDSLTCRVVFRDVNKNRHPCLLTCMEDAAHAVYVALIWADMSDAKKEYEGEKEEEVTL